MPNIVNLWAEANADMLGDDVQPTLTIGKTIVGNQSIASFRLTGSSVASGAMLEFQGKGSFISITSTVLTTVSNTDYAIVVQVGLETRYLPLFKAAALVGGAAYS